MINYYLNPGHYGKVYCTSNPSGTKIYFNDSLISNTTPYILTNIFPSRYKIKYTKDNHRADSCYALVRGNDLTLFSLSLEDTTVWVSYRINNSGIISNYLEDIIVDKDNVKWIGTADRGICKFDGKNWHYLDNINSPLINNSINDIEIDKSNKLWIATVNSLQTFDGENWVDFTSLLPA